MSKSQDSLAERYNPITAKSDLNKNILEITIASKQAIEILEASKNVSLNSKPVLLYYSYIRLARILFLSTYNVKYNRTPSSKTHGLEFTEDMEVKCKKAGAFPRFQDSFTCCPELYLNESKFRFEDLLEQPTDKFRLYSNIYGKKDFSVKEASKPDRVWSLNELTREILFIYLMSMLSRYKSVLWKEIIEEGEYAWKIVDYLRSSQSTFPNQILNYLHGVNYAFFPEMRVGPDEADYNPDIL